MMNKLDTILQHKQHEIRQLRHNMGQDMADLLAGKTQRIATKNFKEALHGPSLSIIAEIKRKSPSKGHLAKIDDAAHLSTTYINGGANAISVLTDEPFFGGSMDDLIRVTQHLRPDPCPVLRKDFVIDPIQIAQAILAGADAVLCIVAVLGQKTKTLLQAAKDMGIDVLVEVHDRYELDIALNAQAEIIGINNRDLTTLKVNPHHALSLVNDLPHHLVRVAESGILDPTLARTYHQAGFHAVLIGEALVTAQDPGAFMRACRHV